MTAKGQLGLSALVISAHVCVKQHKGGRLVRRVPALASEMIMKSLREVEENSSARFHKSLRKMIRDAEINLTIIG